MKGAGFARVAVGVPRVRVADVIFNRSQTAQVASLAAGDGADVIVFPELGITGHSNDDLFHQATLLDAAAAALGDLAQETQALESVIVVGAPLRMGGRLFNCAVVLHHGVPAGVIPKSYLPNYREFYEKRQFAAARDASSLTIEVLGTEVPFGPDLLFRFDHVPDLCMHVEICEDVWVPVPPSTWAALAGATLLVNLSASNITIGKAAYRRQLCASQSSRLIAAYAYTSAGFGESTTDLAWDGDGFIYDHGDLIAETKRFSDTNQIALADVDLERISQERLRMTSFIDCARDHLDALRRFRSIELTQPTPQREGLRRNIERFPFVPSDPVELDERCDEAFQIQVQGLVTRLEATARNRLVIGVSGGLDSTHALLVACRAMDRMGLPRTHILGVHMPGFATSPTTRSNAMQLMEAVGVEGRVVDIRPSAWQMLADLDHPVVSGADLHDVTYENVQAGERTSHLFRMANQHGGLVVGTSDLSELALGWCTFGVGDHMSHYNVNGSVPKTLISFLIRWAATNEQFEHAAETLVAVANTAISPELVPGDPDAHEPTQLTEQIIGPYALHDFFLYHLVRYGRRPSRILDLAHHAWGDPANGQWPPIIPAEQRRGYNVAAIAHWLRVFLERFFANQFKRSTLPNGPKIGSGGSLSPRGDWRAPSDASASVWLAELEAHLQGLGVASDGPGTPWP